MELFVTIISGVAILVLGELTQKLWLEPMKALREQITEITEVLTEHEALIIGAEAAPSEALKSASLAIGKCSIKLRGKTQMIPLYSIVRRVYKLPKESSISKAIEALNSISNLLVSNRNNKSVLCSYFMQDALQGLGFEVESSKLLDQKIRPHFERNA